MKIVKNYQNFSEDYKLNENILGQTWGAIINYFKKHFSNHAWIYYALFLDKKGQLPKHQVELICPESYLNKSQLPNDREISQELKDAFDAEYGDKNLDNNEIDHDKIEQEKELSEGILDSGEYISLSHPDPNMRDVNVAELKKRILRVYEMNAIRAEKHKGDNFNSKSQFSRKKTHALFIWGAPGIGKTEILHQVARELQVAVEEWHLATIEPTDFRGVPRVENVVPGSKDPKDERSVTKLPALFPTSDGPNGKGGIMFFDELNRAPEMVLGAALSLCLSGKHGQYELPPHWIVIAAGNRPDDIPDHLVDDKILWNRFAHVNYSPNVEEWAEYSRTLPYVNPDLIEFLTKKDKEGRYVYAEYYHQLSPEKPHPNWPSPRTWEMASEEEYFERSEDWNNRLDKKEIKNIYQDLVGYKPAVAFAEFSEQQEAKRAIERQKEEERKRKERPKDEKSKENEPFEDENTNLKPGRGRGKARLK